MAGRVPVPDLAQDGHAGTAPVGSYPPNGFGAIANGPGHHHRLHRAPPEAKGMAIRISARYARILPECDNSTGLEPGGAGETRTRGELRGLEPLTPTLKPANPVVR
jgi:hypothetical protein